MLLLLGRLRGLWASQWVFRQVIDHVPAGSALRKEVIQNALGSISAHLEGQERMRNSYRVCTSLDTPAHTG